MNEEEFEELIILWKEYGKESDNKLTKDAIALKQKVKMFIYSLPNLEEE